MSLHPSRIGAVPAETARVAALAFPRGTVATRLRDEFAELYRDEDFAALYPKRGQPGLAPWRLALVTVLQFLEHLSDRQAADAVRARIDWKYALGLELTGLCHVHVRRVGWATPTPRSPPVPECSNPYRGHRFPRDGIAHAVRLYLRFALSVRDVEELLAERGIAVSDETVRRWVAKFGAQYAEELRKREARAGRTWHLDEVFSRMAGKQVYLWRAVDEHGQVLDVLVQEHRDTAAAERFFRQLLGSTGGPPDQIVTDSLASYRAWKR